jgi:hypothetical protein
MIWTTSPHGRIFVYNVQDWTHVQSSRRNKLNWSPSHYTSSLISSPRHSDGRLTTLSSPTSSPFVIQLTGPLDRDALQLQRLVDQNLDTTTPPHNTLDYRFTLPTRLNRSMSISLLSVTHLTEQHFTFGGNATCHVRPTHLSVHELAETHQPRTEPQGHSIIFPFASAHTSLPNDDLHETPGTTPQHHLSHQRSSSSTTLSMTAPRRPFHVTLPNDDCPPPRP